MIECPAFLGGETIHLLAYPVESAIAEKLQAMVALGEANSRMKDFYDVWICSRHLDVDADTLLTAVSATFNNRETPLPPQNSRRLRQRSLKGIALSGMRL
jgi:predicted nucleotidyltransferase component of viral defense system